MRYFVFDRVNGVSAPGVSDQFGRTSLGVRSRADAELLRAAHGTPIPEGYTLDSRGEYLPAWDDRHNGFVFSEEELVYNPLCDLSLPERVEGFDLEIRFGRSSDFVFVRDGWTYRVHALDERIEVS